jgi:hypothetical protein
MGPIPDEGIQLQGVNSVFRIGMLYPPFNGASFLGCSDSLLFAHHSLADAVTPRCLFRVDTFAGMIGSLVYGVGQK